MHKVCLGHCFLFFHLIYICINDISTKRRLIWAKNGVTRFATIFARSALIADFQFSGRLSMIIDCAIMCHLIPGHPRSSHSRSSQVISSYHRSSDSRSSYPKSSRLRPSHFGSSHSRSSHLKLLQLKSLHLKSLDSNSSHSFSSFGPRIRKSGKGGGGAKNRPWRYDVKC